MAPEAVLLIPLTLKLTCDLASSSFGLLLQPAAIMAKRATRIREAVELKVFLRFHSIDYPTLPFFHLVLGFGNRNEIQAQDDSVSAPIGEQQREFHWVKK